MRREDFIRIECCFDSTKSHYSAICTIWSCFMTVSVQPCSHLALINTITQTNSYKKRWINIFLLLLYCSTVFRICMNFDCRSFLTSCDVQIGMHIHQSHFYFILFSFFCFFSHQFSAIKRHIYVFFSQYRLHSNKKYTNWWIHIDFFLLSVMWCCCCFVARRAFIAGSILLFWMIMFWPCISCTSVAAHHTIKKRNEQQ